MNRMKELREERKLNMKEAAQRLGIPYTTYVNYEKGLREPNSEMLIQIANFYNTSIDYLLGRSDDPVDESVLDIVNEIDIDLLQATGNIRDALILQKLRDKNISNVYPIELKKFPLLGEIACGEPIYADEDRESYVMAGANIRADFCLKAKGDSMTGTRIMDGDIVFIRKQDMVEDGEIAAVVIDDDATLKRVYYDREAGIIQLVAENPAYKPLVYTGSRLNEIHILGKAVAFQSDVR